ncbi:hypothetical protein [Cellulomonas sp. NTE-D12]|uniref:hypothetical protein n=1 Tax=Cellulomonas sp. NTE-D12 TaxID=2962632 RepID=UPI00308183F6|nr:hypothetical protein CELD12_07930 [Cellulomonas sp. NTE-D12]
MDELDLENLRVDVTDQDISTARSLWVAARDGDADDARVALLFQDLFRLISAQAQQIADDFRAAH